MNELPARLLGIRDSAQYLGIGASTVARMIAAGELESVKVASRRLVPREALDRYVDRLREVSA